MGGETSLAQLVAVSRQWFGKALSEALQR